MQPTAPTEAPRPVARTTVARGEAVVGATTVTPVGEQRPTAVAPVKPTAPTGRAKPVRQQPTRKILPGDLICGDCGEGNPPARNFCSRCGSTLKNAVVAKRKWWQRLVPKRKRKTMEAGARPWKAKDGGTKQRRKGGALAKVYVKLRPIVAGALLLSGLVVGFSPNLREKVTGKIGDVKDSLTSKVSPTYVPLSPIDISSTSATPENPVSNVIDGNKLSFWVAPGDDREPTIVVQFDEPFDLERIQLWNGAASGFKDHERVRDIHFVFDTNQTFDLVVNDLPDGQQYAIKNGQGVRQVELHITGTYSSLASDQLGISEIEFYFRR